MKADPTTCSGSDHAPLLHARQRLCAGAFTLALLLAVAPEAHSSASAFSNQAEDSESGGLTEVVVTARRKDEKLEKVPVAVAALSQADVAERRIISEADLESATPGLTVRQTSSSNQLSFALRGQALDAFSFTSPTVLTYFNEFQTSGVTSTAFFDLQSVQILKGPQGTLFGRNATGGAVLYQAQRPTKELGGYLRLGAGNYSNKEFEGAFNMPLGEMVALRVAGAYQDREGFQRNLVLGLRPGSADNKNVRASLLVSPSESLENLTVVQYGKYGGYSAALKISNAYPIGAIHNSNLCPPGGCVLNATTAILYRPPGALGPADPGSPVQRPGYNGILDFINRQKSAGFLDLYNDMTSAHSADQKLAVNKTIYTISDALIVKNIIGYNKVISHDQTDDDGSPYQVLTIGVTGGPGAEGYTYDSKQISDELQLTGLVADKKLNYIIGAYYGRDDEGQNIPLNVGADYPGGTVLATGPVRYNFQTQDRSKALFFQGSYELTPGFHATAGLRETWNESGIVHRRGAVPDDANAALAGVPDASFTTRKPSWTLGLDYQLTPEALIYVAQRGSWRTGGYNGTSSVPDTSKPNGFPFLNNQFKPETTWDVELGAKFAGTLGNMPSRLTLAVYDQTVKDIQRAVYFGISAQTSNARRARVTGVELDGQIGITPWLQVGATYAYTNGRYTDANATVVDSTGVTHNLLLGPFGDTPKQAGSAYARFLKSLPGQGGELAVRADIYAQSEFFYTNLNDSYTPDTRIGGYSIANLRVEWNDILGSQVSVSAYGRNIANKEYLVGGLSLGAVVGLNTTLPGLPRMYGVDAGVRF